MQQTMTLTKRATAFARGFASDPLSHWPFPAISRRVYGNLSGFRQNLYGSIHTSYHRLTARPAEAATLEPETRAQARQLRRNGAFMVSGWLDPEVVARIGKRVLELARTEGNHHSEYMTVLEGQHLAKNAPEIFEVYNPKVRAFVEAYFGGPFLVNSTSFRLTRHVPDEVVKKGEVYSDHWHTDSGPTSVLAMFVLLKDLAPDGGPTAALEIPATKAVVRGGYTSRKDSGEILRQIEESPSKLEMVGPAGTLLFVNVARCLHRAGIPAPGHEREWLQFRLYPDSGPTDTTRLRPARILEWTNGIKQNY